MAISATELLVWDDIARRDLPWRNPGVSRCPKGLGDDVFIDPVDDDLGDHP